MALPESSKPINENRVKFLGNIKELPSSAWGTLIETGKEDPRRIVHAVKLGVALTLVCLLYLLGPLVKVFGANAMLAVMTVVLVFEFTAGATLYKGFNRGIGTAVAALLSLFIEFVAENAGQVGKVIILGISVFIIGSGSTFVRFIPYIKKNYDYGVLIFLLTFNLITISTPDLHNILGMARDRLYTVAVATAVCVLMSLFILPNWSGEDLEKSTVNKLEDLAKSIEACVNDYFEEEKMRDEKSSRYRLYKGYRAVLDSKSTDETQALFASWEPRHSRLRYPWQQYVQLGTTLRHFAYSASALHTCLESEIQAPLSFRLQFKDPCIRLTAEVVKVLTALAVAIKDHRDCPPNVLSEKLHGALHDLNAAIKSQPAVNLGPTKTTPYASNLPSPHPEKADVVATLTHLRSKRVDDDKARRTKDQANGAAAQRVLMPQLSMLVIRSLEFSDALPLASFASVLVEMVARLDLVIEDFEILVKAARFRKYTKIPSRKFSERNNSARWPGRVVPQVDEEARPT